MDLEALVDRFGAARAEPVHIGHSAATVVRLDRGRERPYYKAGPDIDTDADRLAWLGSTGFPCPRIVDRADRVLHRPGQLGELLSLEGPAEKYLIETIQTLGTKLWTTA